MLPQLPRSTTRPTRTLKYLPSTTTALSPSRGRSTTAPGTHRSGVTQQQFSLPGAPLAAVYYPVDDHLEAFTTDRAGAMCVEWKVNNRAWVPCPYPILGTPAAPIASPANLPKVLRTERIGQLTGSRDPEGKPVLNSTDSGEWNGAGIDGVDLGANTEHNGTLFVFFGDVPRGSRTDGPVQDADLVGWTVDRALRPGGFTLHPVKSGQYFDPFTVDHGIGILPTDRTPTGAFSYVLSTGALAYVFGLWDDPSDPLIPNTNVRLPTTILASKEDPTQPGAYHLEFTFSKHKFWQVAPVVVRNAEHELPETNGDGLVLFGGGEGNAVYLAWMRLDPSFGPVLNTVRYYIGDAPGGRWSEPGTQHEPEAKPLFSLNPVYTSVSAAWLSDVNQWIVLYSNAFYDPPTNRMDPAGYGAAILVDEPSPDRLCGEGWTSHRKIVRQLSRQVANRLRVEFPFEARLRCRDSLQRLGIDDLGGPLPDPTEIQHGQPRTRNDLWRLPNRHRLVVLAAIEIHADGTHEIVDESEYLLVRRRPVVVFIRDIAIERRRYKVD